MMIRIAVGTTVTVCDAPVIVTPAVVQQGQGDACGHTVKTHTDPAGAIDVFGVSVNVAPPDADSDPVCDWFGTDVSVPEIT